MINVKEKDIFWSKKEANFISALKKVNSPNQKRRTLAKIRKGEKSKREEIIQKTWLRTELETHAREVRIIFRKEFCPKQLLKYVHLVWRGLPRENFYFNHITGEVGISLTYTCYLFGYQLERSFRVKEISDVLIAAWQCWHVLEAIFLNENSRLQQSEYKILKGEK